jgi:hypothetical protein
VRLPRATYKSQHSSIDQGAKTPVDTFGGERARPASWVRSFQLDDATILLDERGQALFALNPSAALIWCCIEDGWTSAAIRDELRSTLGIPVEEADRQLRQAYDAWAAHGLLVGSRPAPRVRVRAARVPSIHRRSAIPRPAPRHIRHYRLLGRSIRLACTRVVQQRRIHAVLAHLAVMRPPRTRADLNVAIDVGRGGRHVMSVEGVSRHLGTIDTLVPAVVQQISAAIANRQQCAFGFHAAVVGNHRGCLLMPAPAGCGKSTLTAGLVASGLIYFSDELAPLEKDTLRVLPLPMPIGIKSGSYGVLAPRFPALARAIAHRREDAKVLRYLLPPSQQFVRSAVSAPVHCLVFPQYDAAAQDALSPIGRADALRQLLAECLAVPLPLTVERERTLIEWIKQLDCYRLTFSSLDRALGLLHDAMRSDAVADRPGCSP